MRRHAFTTLLPGILCSIPELRELRIRPLGHPGFWDQFAPPHNRCFVAQNVRILHISESFPILMGGALPVVSTIQELASLNIGFPESDWDDHANYDLQPDDWDKGSIHPLSKLRHLQITSRITAIATLVDAIVAPELEDIQLESTLRESSVVAAAAIRAVLGTLCSRNKSSIRKVHLDLRGLEYNPRRDSTQSSEFGASIFTLLKPTLQFQHLRELSILVSFGFRKPLEFPGPTMLTAWPNLRKLLLHGVVISPDSLRAAARACPHLQSLTAQGLSEDFRHIPASTLDQHDGSLRDASSSNAGGHGLQELRLLRPSDMVPADVIKIAQFLAGLFPRLCAERSSGRGIYSSRSWNNVLKELTKIQVSQGSRRA
ncbi:uncharacterized protein B0H18DRAFT_140691 [Fomitopsis serialis]|uniref:uncharacterized protein n=1 Tax=Fomitopsis serialis TaxID=139415 RepID=UPI0020072D85|nr:uncharacterized protein B0H18DRAFT_140691 [Neoantrodia serialis]KAH9914232.1 hypothetical protein B0H18DRAFT_140691 [Neoantrodia serialis]